MPIIAYYWIKFSDNFCCVFSPSLKTTGSQWERALYWVGQFNGVLEFFLRPTLFMVTKSL